MKNRIYTLALSALLLAGCTQEESTTIGEEVKMNFTANISNGMQSRAGEESGNEIIVDKMICAVFKQENGILTGEAIIREEIDIDTNGKVIFTPTLLRGYEYGIVFWAYKDGSNIYDTDDLSNITFTPANNQDPTDEDLVVYTKTIKDITTDTSGENTTISLTRPLAQVNVATTQSEWDFVTDNHQENFSSYTLILTNCCNTYNALTGEYSGNSTFKYEGQLSESNKIDQKIILGTGYTFPESTPTCSINVYVKDVESPIYKKEVPNIPTAANHRTNIIPQTTTDEAGNEVGGLMTGSVSFTVTLTEGYTTDTNKTPDDLKNTIEE